MPILTVWPNDKQAAVRFEGAPPLTAVLESADSPAAVEPCMREDTRQLARRAQHISLGGDPRFNQCYMEQMLFPGMEET